MATIRGRNPHVFGRARPSQGGNTQFMSNPSAIRIFVIYLLQQDRLPSTSI
jgi:hypothetical protein